MASPRRAAAKRRVLLVFHSQFPEASAMLEGIARYLRSGDSWSVFLDGTARAETDIEWLLRQRWDGVISRHTGPVLVQACMEQHLPLIDLNDTPLFVGVPKIRPDNIEIGRIGAAYLLGRGFRQLAFSSRRNDGWARERQAGFLETVARHGLGCELDESDEPPALTPSANHAQIERMAGWLRRLPRPIGIMACQDARALPLLEAARAVGLRVPEDAAILGANNDPAYCDLANPPLSSVATNPALSGFRAAEHLALLMSGRTAASLDLRIAPLRVISRRSTDVLAAGDRHVALAQRHILAQACDGLSVEQVLAAVAISRSQLEKKFRACLGWSPQAEIRRVQLARIRQLLAETDYPLKRIAELSGFEHPEHMCVVFRRLTGETPGAYRKRTQCGEHAGSVTPPP